MTLHRLASRLGVVTSYTSAWRGQVSVPDATTVAVIAAMGVDTTRAGWVDLAHRDLDALDAARQLEPVLIAWDGVFDPVGAFARVARRNRLTILDEQGAEVTRRVLSGARVPFGYHHVHLDQPTDRNDAGAAVIISAPKTLPPPRERAVFVFAPLFALRPGDADRATDLRELDELIDWAAESGARGVLTLPLLAGFSDHPIDPSPYAPVSRSMWNELYAVLDRPTTPTTAPLIDYAAWHAATKAGLQAAVLRVAGDPVRAAAVAQYVATRPEVTAYARFRAACERYGHQWRSWPTHLRHGSIDADEVDPSVVRYHELAQWLMHEQLGDVAARARSRGVTLGLDLAVGTHADAFDVWAHQSEYASGCSVGAPPDTFFPSGQGWGFPPPLPEQTRASGYRDLRAALRHHLAVAGLLRVDHVMGLRRLFWIPDGAAPRDGTYVHAALDEQLAVICLEAHRTGAVIVGENLGLVPPEVDTALRTHGLLGMTVAYGALEAPKVARRPLTAPAHDVAALGTHDMATFAGFVHGDDLQDRLELGLGDPALAKAQQQRRARALAAARAARHLAPDASIDVVLDTFLDELAASEAPVLVVALEDLWAERTPHNVPGTSTERPNWRRRAASRVRDLPPSVSDRVKRICLRQSAP